MGQYKVPQNVESEDKILGPLSLKQFIYAIIGIGYGLLTFAIFKSVIVIWILIGLPPMLAFLALGLYQREDQPLETYIFAVARFITQPKLRLWEKEPIFEVFRVEPPPPKPIVKHRDPREVRSQLQQLANVVDTRGWAPKAASVQEPEEVPVIDLQDRLGADVLSQPPVIADAPVIEVPDDILDTAGVKAQNLNVLIENTTKSIRHEAVEKMAHPTAQVGANAAPSHAPKPRANTSAMTAAPSGDILKLATEGGDLSVAQIAAQAGRQQTLTEGQAVTLRNGSSPTAPTT